MMTAYPSHVPRIRWGFTLIEVLVSLAIGMTLIALGWSGYRTSDQLAKRTLARLALHQDAAQVEHALTGDFCTIHHGAQWRVERQATTGSPAEITVTALRSTLRRGWSFYSPRLGSASADWGLGADASADPNSVSPVGLMPTDLTWFRWCWRANANTTGARVGTLYRAMAPRVRKEYLGDTWTQPRRSINRKLTDNNFVELFQIPAPPLWLTDLNTTSDEADLTVNLVPIAQRVKDFAVAWTTNGGNIVYIDAGSGPSSNLIDGVWLDGHDSNLVRLRPAVLRVRFTLVDPAADLRNDPDALDARIVQQAFAWSVPLTPLGQP